jgi:hypothetical protein
MGAETGHCGRCNAQVSVLSPWPGFRWVKRCWYVGLLVLFALMPIIMAEITLLMPLALVFALAAGPVHALAAQKATCRDCGAEL